MYEEVYQQILRTQLPPATERVAIALLNLAANLAGQVTLSMDDFLTLCNSRNQRAAMRHLTRIKQMGIIHYRTNTKSGQVSVTFRSWMALAEEGVGGKIEEKVAIETEEERSEAGGPLVEGNLMEMAMALLNTTQLLLKSAMPVADMEPMANPESTAPATALPAPHDAPDPAANLVTKTTRTGQQVVVEVDAQNLVDHPDQIAPIRVPLAGATLVIQMDLEPTTENRGSNDDSSTDPAPKKPKVATRTKPTGKSVGQSAPAYPHQKVPLLHRSAKDEQCEGGENRRVKQDGTEDEFFIHIKGINKEDIKKNKKDIKKDKEAKRTKRTKSAQNVQIDSSEIAPESTIPLEEQDRSFKLLTDPEVGITEKVARGMATEHPFELIRRQIFAWREDLRIGKMHNTGALVYRINNQFYAPELTMADRRSKLYQRHRSPFEVEVEANTEERVRVEAEFQVGEKVEEQIEERARVVFEEGIIEGIQAEATVENEAEEAWDDLGVWDQLLAEMQQILPTATFDIFLAKSRLVGIDPDGTYLIQVADPYHQSYLEQRLQGILKRTFAHIVKKSRVQLRIESTQRAPQKPVISTPVAFIQNGKEPSTFRGRLGRNVRKL